jgi:hypothetical protein
MGKIDLIETDILYTLIDVKDACHKTAIKVFDIRFTLCSLCEEDR